MYVLSVTMTMLCNMLHNTCGALLNVHGLALQMLNELEVQRNVQQLCRWLAPQHPDCRLLANLNNMHTANAALGWVLPNAAM